ncbi:hypothetical protein PVAND_014774 [Polypedilum vanderplanki]|uniref:Bulb-type lectin domain-containing protein n=1 Tax=Polypedilum vanderplanki TaxID=319348 RepID=A0A9J6BAC2_POLVA|nr:hypothetical protein PVAND_014774 [Polypedilum vanderplanki]
MLLKQIFAITILITILNQARCNTNQNSTEDKRAEGTTNFIQGDKLAIDQCLVEGFSLKSANGEFFLNMQTDGNLVIYTTAKNVPIWATNTATLGGKRVCMQQDGDFNIYSQSNNLIWSSKTKGKSGIYVKLQNSGNLEMFTKADKKVWETK